MIQGPVLDHLFAWSQTDAIHHYGGLLLISPLFVRTSSNQADLANEARSAVLLLHFIASSQIIYELFENSFIQKYFFGKSLFKMERKDFGFFVDPAFEPFNRRLSYILHECCHHILRMLFPQSYGVGAKNRKVHYFRSGKTSGGDWEEWQVDVLASVLLLPANCVKQNMKTFGLGQEMRLLNRVFAPTDYARFEEMATYMGVSKTALAIRMQRLGLLKRSDLGDPYALVRIENTEGDSLWQNSKFAS